MHSHRRLEGASDPDDMVAIVAISCPVCATQGTLSPQYGPMGHWEEDADVLQHPERRGSGRRIARILPTHPPLGVRANGWSCQLRIHLLSACASSTSHGTPSAPAAQD